MKIVERTCEDETVVDNATVNNDDEIEDDNATVTDTKPVIRSRVTKREALYDEDHISRVSWTSTFLTFCLLRSSFAFPLSAARKSPGWLVVSKRTAALRGLSSLSI